VIGFDVDFIPLNGMGIDDAKEHKNNESIANESRHWQSPQYEVGKLLV